VAILRDSAGNPLGVKASVPGPYDDFAYSPTDFVTDSYYDSGWRLCVENISEVKQARTAILELPAANFDIIQNLKLKNRRFKISGTILINMELGKQELRSIITSIGSLESDKIPQTPIFYASVSFQDRGKRPTETAFDLDVVEIKY
jgi:hypothetical protein